MLLGIFLSFSYDANVLNKIILIDNLQKRKPNYFLKFVLVDWLSMQKAGQFLG
tara:strand:+ start:1531 stop:1689 length:159 start_codon:yes stop_codon:yes gene_type:complete